LELSNSDTIDIKLAFETVKNGRRWRGLRALSGVGYHLEYDISISLLARKNSRAYFQDDMLN
jgi:hypothetical protein